ncbi:MAG: SGNH/GDSL hydrolase family protein [Candidatus Saccharibacteria bacterium]
MKKYGYAGIIILLLIGVGYRAGHHDSKTTFLTEPAGRIVALGDSVAAGVGLKDASDSSACDRTNQAYSYVAAKALNLSLTSVACSQATLAEGVLGSQTVNQLAEPTQLEALFAVKQPDVITLTIGANDAGWIQAFGKCYTGICGTDADTTLVNARLSKVTTNIATTIQMINDHYTGMKPMVLVTGYYQIFPETLTTGCSDETGIDASELAWVRAQVTAISTAVKTGLPAANNVKFVQPDFTGHELCSKEPWVQGVADAQPYHPTADGQKSIAILIETEVKK